MISDALLENDDGEEDAAPAASSRSGVAPAASELDAVAAASMVVLRRLAGRSWAPPVWP